MTATAGWADAADATQARERSGSGRLRTTAARALITAVPLATVVWVPVASIPGLGNVTALDVILLSLWPLALVGVRAWPGPAAATSHALRIAVLALLPGLFAGLAVLVFGALDSAYVPDASTNAVAEVLLQVKRLGAAAILPLAALVYGSPRLRRSLAASLLLASVAMTVFALYPALHAVLPVQSMVAESLGAGNRQSALVANPNDYAYLSILGLALLAAFATGRDDRRPVRYVMVLAGAIGACTALALSGSRSGLIGLVAGAAYLLVRGRLPVAHKGLVVLAVVALLAAGIQRGDVLRERLARIYEEGTAESSLAGRLDAQQVMLSVWLAHPLGVGYQNFVPVSRRFSGAQPFVDVEGADSIYVDTLAASGPLGLLSLLGLLWSSWRYLGRVGGRGIQADVPRAGWLAMAVVGLSAIVPMSVFIAPYFFLLLACATLVAPDVAEGHG